MRPFFFVRAAYLAALLPLLYFSWRGTCSWWFPFALSVVYLAILAMGATRIRWNFFMPAWHSAPSKGKVIALSFDDGPAAYSGDILDILKLESVRAAFFAIGKRAVEAPEVVQRWHEDGHLIGNHSYTHGFGFDLKLPAAMAREIDDTNAAIERICGSRPLLFRPPYGVTNPSLAKAVRRTGMTAVGWSLRSFDTQAKDPQALLKRILDQVRDGDVILLHDSMQVTAVVLTALIQACREKGFTFVRPDELLGLEPYA